MIRRGERWESSRPASRAQSSVIGVVLLALMVVAGGTVLVYAGSAMLEQQRGNAELSTAVTAMQTLDQTVRRAKSSEGGDWTVNFNVPADRLAVVTGSSDPSEMGRIDIKVSGHSEVKIPLGTVRYERNGQVVAYQGGGVWRSSGTGSVAVSPPPVSYRTSGGPSTVTFPVVTIDGEATGDELTVERVDRSSLLSTVGLSSRRVPPGTDITVEVHSEFYRGWARVLTEEFGASAVSVDDDAETVTLELRKPNTAPVVNVAAYSDGAASGITNTVCTDSYQSPDYPSTWSCNPGTSSGDEGDVRTTSEFEPTNDVDIDGTVYAEGGSDSITNAVTVSGEVRLGPVPADGVTSITVGPAFGDTFSTTSDLYVANDGALFEGEVIVGGAPGNGYALSVPNDPTFEKTVYVDGTLEAVGAPTFAEDVYVDGEVTELRGTVGDPSDSATGHLLAKGKIKLYGGTVDGVVASKNGRVKLVSGSEVNRLYALGGSGETVIKGGSTVHGDVRAGNDLVINDATVDGDVYAEGDVTLKNNANIVGDLYVGGNLTVSTRNREVTVLGDVFVEGDIDEFQSVDQIGGHVHVMGNVDTTDDVAVLGVDHGSHGRVDIRGRFTADGSVDVGGGVLIEDGVYASGPVERPPGWAAPADIDPVTENNPGAFDSNTPDDVDADTSDGAGDFGIGIASFDFDAEFTMRSPLDPTVPSRSPVDDDIQDVESEFAASNDNGDNGVFTGPSDHTLPSTCDPCTLSSGDYYINQIDLGSGEELVLDTSGGPVDVYLVDGIQMISDGRITVAGAHRANVYVGGTGTSTVSLTNNAEIITDVPYDPSVPATSGTRDRYAPNFWLYLKPSSGADFSQQATMTGVIYGPGGGGSGATVRFTNQNKLFGAVVAHVTSMTVDTEIHYDTRLSGTNIFPGSGAGGPATVDYVYFSQQKMAVDQ